MIVYNTKYFRESDWRTVCLGLVQKEYLDALIDLAPLKPIKITIDTERAYVWFNYVSFDYPIFMTYVGLASIDEFLNCNIPDIAYNLTACEEW